MRVLPTAGHDPIGIDHRDGPTTDVMASITDADAMADALAGADALIHTATLHKPQVASRPRRDFVDVNVGGTLNLLECALAAGVSRVVFTSTTSAFGDALVPKPGEPAVWIDETVTPIPKNIYGATKCAAEDICALFARNEGLPVTVLRTSRFFPEKDDSAAARSAFADPNLKANEFLHRRADIEDVASAHIAALDYAPPKNFARFVISAPPPFTRDDLTALPQDAPLVIGRIFPHAREIYATAGFVLPPSITRVYSSHRALEALDWSPKFTFAKVLDQIGAGAPIGSDLARQVGQKGYETSTYGTGEFPDA